MGKHNILENKLYLYVTEFFAGMAVMAVEQGASRLLAPYFSSSQIVWTIIIGTIMIAMALGNIWGGRQADRDPNPARLYRRIIIAAIWIAAIPLVGKYIILGISGLMIVAVNTNFLIWAAFTACMVIFVFPLFLLGTVTPCLTKYTMDSLSDNASIVGRLGACNTVGSIIGTFLPTFITIPSVGTAVTFLIFSAVLLVVGILYFAVNGGSRRLTAAGIILFLLASVFGNSDSFAFWEKDIAFEGESVYNYLQVRDGDRATILSTNVLFGVQSIRMKQANLTGLYYDYALLAPVLGNLGTDDGKGKSVLVLGMGTGTFAQQTKQYFPEATVSGVEIDEKITDLAHRYFELPESIPVVTYDGRAYLNADTETYDVIMVDAYQDITIPFQMSSKEFFGLVKDHLKPGGVMVVNMNMYTDKAGGITDYLSDTISTQFSQVYTADVEGSTNRELFATNDESLFTNLPEKIASLKDTELRTMMTSVYGNLTERTPGNLVFTDDKAPVELMGMDTIDGIIKDEIGTYKQIFKEKGLQGLFDAAA
jgi:spermidine synthase